MVTDNGVHYCINHPASDNETTCEKALAIGQEKTNTDSLIGRTEKILTTVDNGAGTGMLKLGDVEWRAVSEDGSVIPEGTLVVIQKIEGTKLFVRREIPEDLRG